MIKRSGATILLTLVVGVAAGCGGDEEGESEAKGACGAAVEGSLTGLCP